MVDQEGTNEEANANAEVEATPTTEQLLETASAQLKEATARADKAESSEQGLRGSLQEKDRLLRNQSGNAELATKVSGLEDAMQIMAGMMGKGDMTTEEAQGYKQEFANAKKQREDEGRRATARSQQEVYAAEAQVVFKEAQEVFKDDPEKLEGVEDSLDAGKLQRAKDKIARATVTKTETAADMEARLRKELQTKEGDRDSEDGQASGGKKVYTAKQIDDMPMEQYAKEKDAIDQAYLEGKIK